MSTLAIIVKFLPEIVSFIKSLQSMVERGIDEIQIKQNIKGINKAFQNEDRQAAARALNDIFRR